MSNKIDIPHPSKPSNFLRQIIERDLAGRLAQQARRFEGKPGGAVERAGAAMDWARIRTRFPPEPNGYLHIGHAKSICLNFGLAADYGGACHLRFDDTNPETERAEFEQSIAQAVRWLGFDWRSAGTEHCYWASDYFPFMEIAARALIEAGLAYVDEQEAEAIRQQRGSLTEGGRNSPHRNRPVAESLARFAEMQSGRHADGVMVLRAKIDMASPNINLRDPVIYRIRHHRHFRAGDLCLYPMYTFAHPIEDALEGITHSICTLEFEDQRPFYDWLLQHLARLGLLTEPLPHQHEFARLNLSHTVTSKRKLAALVQEGLVAGWDDPRLPTLVGLRRRGFTPESIRLFCERIGVAKADSWVPDSDLETALRDDLEPKAPRAMAVIEPLQLVLTNWPQDQFDECRAPRHPHAELGSRHFRFGREIWIDRADFAEAAPPGFQRLTPGATVRLKYGHAIECTGCIKDSAGQVERVEARVIEDSKSGTPGANRIKARGVLTWVASADAVPVELRLYERLFTRERPDSEDWRAALNPHSLRSAQGFAEPSLAAAQPGEPFQFERLGYFTRDSQAHPEVPIFHRSVTLKEAAHERPAR